MNGNPLKTIIFVSLLNTAYTLYQILVLGVFNLLGILVAIASSIFIFLYFKMPRYAGAFLFYSTLPIYPLYFLFGALGLNATPPSVGTYLVLALIDVGLLFLLWRLKNRYEVYLRDEQINAAKESSI